MNRFDNSARNAGETVVAQYRSLKECKIMESVVVQPSKRAKEVSPVRIGPQLAPALRMLG